MSREGIVKCPNVKDKLSGKGKAMKQKAKQMTALDPGIAAVRQSGLIAELAKELGITRQAIYKWDRVPAERVPEVARFTGIKRHILRRDLYGRIPARIS
jgi:hypothetical protein